MLLHIFCPQIDQLRSPLLINLKISPWTREQLQSLLVKQLEIHPRKHISGSLMERTFQERVAVDAQQQLL